MLEAYTPTYIYTLINPTNGEIFYVGQTIDTEKRLEQHVQEAFVSFFNGYRIANRAKYIAHMIFEGVCPVIAVIDCVQQKDADRVEGEWISYFRKQGYAQTNGKSTSDVFFKCFNGLRYYPFEYWYSVANHLQALAFYAAEKNNDRLSGYFAFYAAKSWHYASIARQKGYTNEQWIYIAGFSKVEKTHQWIKNHHAFELGGAA